MKLLSSENISYSPNVRFLEALNIDLRATLQSKKKSTKPSKMFNLVDNHDAMCYSKD